jgi:hypothetical protein
MTIKGGRHQRTGMVSLGKFYKDMRKIETGKGFIIMMNIII